MRFLRLVGFFGPTGSTGVLTKNAHCKPALIYTLRTWKIFVRSMMVVLTKNIVDTAVYPKAYTCCFLAGIFVILPVLWNRRPCTNKFFTYCTILSSVHLHGKFGFQNTIYKDRIYMYLEKAVSCLFLSAAICPILT